MKIICLQENLKDGLLSCERAIGKNITLPVLNNLLIEDDGGRIKISATDLEIGINYWLPGKIIEKGSVTCPAKVLTNLIVNLPNRKIEMESKNNVLAVRSESVHASVQGVSSEDFPIIPKIKTRSFLKISSGLLKNALGQIINSLASVDTRPEISGIYLKFNKEGITLAATDSFRLSEKKIPEKAFEVAGDLKNTEVIIPQKTIFELVRTIGEGDKALKIFIDPTQILFDLDNVQLISRLIDGQYPAYQSIVPAQFTSQATTLKNDLLGAAKIAGIFASKINDVKIKVLPGKSLLEIESRSELGGNHSKLDAKITGKDQDIVFNYRYLIDGLNNIISDEVFIGFNSEEEPVLMRSPEDQTYLYVIMPIRSGQ